MTSLLTWDIISRKVLIRTTLTTGFSVVQREEETLGELIKEVYRAVPSLVVTLLIPVASSESHRPIPFNRTRASWMQKMRDRRISQLAEDDYRLSRGGRADSNALVKPETNLRARYDMYPMLWINTHTVIEIRPSVIGSNYVPLHRSDLFSMQDINMGRTFHKALSSRPDVPNLGTHVDFIIIITELRAAIFAKCGPQFSC